MDRSRVGRPRDRGPGRPRRAGRGPGRARAGQSGQASEPVKLRSCAWHAEALLRLATRDRLLPPAAGRRPAHGLRPAGPRTRPTTLVLSACESGLSSVSPGQRAHGPCLGAVRAGHAHPCRQRGSGSGCRYPPARADLRRWLRTGLPPRPPWRRPRPERPRTGSPPWRQPPGSCASVPTERQTRRAPHRGALLDAPIWCSAHLLPTDAAEPVIDVELVAASGAEPDDRRREPGRLLVGC